MQRAHKLRYDNKTSPNHLSFSLRSSGRDWENNKTKFVNSPLNWNKKTIEKLCFFFFFTAAAAFPSLFFFYPFVFVLCASLTQASILLQRFRFILLSSLGLLYAKFVGAAKKLKCDANVVFGSAMLLMTTIDTQWKWHEMKNSDCVSLFFIIVPCYVCSIKQDVTEAEKESEWVLWEKSFKIQWSWFFNIILPRCRCSSFRGVCIIAKQKKAFND